MTDDIEKLIESYRGWNTKEIKRYPLAAERVISDLLAKLEAEHETAEERFRNLVTVTNNAMRFQAERDTLRTAIQDAYNAWHMESRERAIEILHAALSRAIDTKEIELDEADQADIEQEERDHIFDTEGY